MFLEKSNLFSVVAGKLLVKEGHMVELNNLTLSDSSVHMSGLNSFI